MDSKKKKLLKEAFDAYITLMLYDFPLDRISEIVADNVTGYGTTVDERVLEIDRLKKIVADQREQGAGLEMHMNMMAVTRRISPDEDTAIFMDEFEISMVVDGEKNIIPLRLTSVFEFNDNTWKLVHLHGSKAVETEDDTWHLYEWKKKNEELQKQVEEKTADLEKKNHELEIEASLEKIRSRVLSMRNSSEVGDVSSLLFAELEKMDIKPSGFSIMIFDKEQDKYELWRAKEVANQGAYETFSIKAMFDKLDQYVPGFSQKLKSSWTKGDPYLVGEFREKMRASFIQANREMADYSDDEFEKIKKMFPDPIFWHLVFFKHGWLGVLQNDQLPEDNLMVIHRFAEVFDFAYTRFLDLKKAEEQALRAEEDLIAIKIARQKAEQALTELKATQTQLIHAEKMASLGELTAGIAHEIQNPLNFVNNFSEVSIELVDELKQESVVGGQQSAVGSQQSAVGSQQSAVGSQQSAVGSRQSAVSSRQSANEILDDIKQNLEKILHHGKRADAIVKGMLQHSRTSTGQKEPTDINELADEYLRLAYHGLRAKDKEFNATLKTDFDESIGKISVIPQDIGRVILNLITNAFYAVDEKKKRIALDLSGLSTLTGLKDYEPTVSVITNKSDGNILISVKDNGNGILEVIKNKIFQPFFTTKPTGQGTGLGLSLSYDIVKAHGGELKVETKEGEGSVFIIQLPVINN
jgi:signal transduction histidine kinase